jgi:hypothetical protein
VKKTSIDEVDFNREVEFYREVEFNREVDFYQEELFCRPDDILIKFVSDLRQVGGFLQVLRFPPPTKLTVTIYL